MLINVTKALDPTGWTVSSTPFFPSAAPSNVLDGIIGTVFANELGSLNWLQIDMLEEKEVVV